MAMMAFFYARGIGQDAVMDYAGSKNINCKYWIVFSYFLYNYPQINNVIVFTYYFCELSLMDVVPEISVKRVLIEIKELIDNTSYIDEDNFFELLSKKFQEKIRQCFSVIIDVINIMEAKLEKLSQYHDFSFFLKEIIGLCKRGIEYRKSNGTIFKKILDGRWINNMSGQFRSPLILQPNGKFSILGNKGNYDQNIALLFGLSTVIRKLLRHEEISECPFHDEIPICKLYNDNGNLEQICLSDPVNIQPFPNGGCLFYNVSLILGLLPIEEYKKYMKE
jgi:hypothetical protein